MRFRVLFLSAIAAALLVSCATVPKETVELSTLLGNRLAETEQHHIAAIELFFEEKRRGANRFFYEEWLPAFSSRYLQDSEMRDVLELARAAGTDHDRLQAMLVIAAPAQRVIAEEHAKLMVPLDEEERDLLKAVQAEYARMQKMNDAVTGLVSSAADVEEQNNRLLERFGVTATDINTRLANISARAAELADKGVDAEDRLARYLERIDD